MDQRLENEIAHGRQIASYAEAAWGWEGAIGKLRWRRRVEMLCSGLRPGSRVLEVGCGTGLLTEEIAKRGVKVYSLDISHELLKKAAGKSGNKEIVFFCSSAYELGFADSVFDNIIGMSVLHHLDMDRALAEFYRVLKKGGKMAFSEPNMLNPHIFCERHFFRERFHNSPDETAFVRFALKRQMRERGFKDIVIDPFDFLYPKIPDSLAGKADSLLRVIEKIPLVSEIAGSLFIRAVK
ncbi:MAG: class I SAM-dependent methyltransferase [Deltaproteobacteria bacterium]|nr:class I SAM-dependent methyltransferase [Deltaproteobacteria bacterium]